MALSAMILTSLTIDDDHTPNATMQSRSLELNEEMKCNTYGNENCRNDHRPRADQAARDLPQGAPVSQLGLDA
jgi:hypothetical protein